MKYSVIVPLYNKAAYIEKTVKSILAQTEQDFEIIVVDDGSTDDSALIVEKIQNEKIRLLKQKNQGVSAARNYGIQNAQGEYIAFLDADDFWMTNFLEVANGLIQTYPCAGMVCPSYQVTYENRIVHPKWRGVVDTEKHLVDDFFEMATGSFWISCSSNTIVKRDAIDKLNYWFAVGETCYEDFDFWIRIGANEAVAHSNIVCATYNRITEKNARKTHYSNKVVYSKTFMQTLDELLNSDRYGKQQKCYLKQIKDRRMVPYIFSLFCVGDRKKAVFEINNWKPTSEYKKYRLALRVISFMPAKALQLIQQIRYKIF